MKKIALATGICTALLAGCGAPPPANPMERHARMAVVAELAARRCAGHAGGYGDVRSMREDANRHAATARSLGATEEDFAKARHDADVQFGTGIFWVGEQQACREMVGALAWQA